MEIPNNRKSSENVGEEADHASLSRRPCNRARREHGHTGTIRKQAVKRHVICGKCLDTSMVDLCNQIGTTAFYLANKLQGKPFELSQDSQYDQFKRNSNKTQSGVFAPNDENVQPSCLKSKPRVNLEPKPGRQHLVHAKRSHRLKSADFVKLEKCSIMSCDGASCGHENQSPDDDCIEIPSASVNSTRLVGRPSVVNESEIRSSRANSDELNANPNSIETALCPICGHLSLYEMGICAGCLESNGKITSVNKSKMSASTSNAQQLRSDRLQPRCRGRQDIDSDVLSKNDKNRKEEHSVFDEISDNVILDAVYVNISSLKQARKRRTPQNADSIKENTGKEPVGALPLRNERIGKRLAKKDARTYIQKSTDPVKKGLHMADEEVELTDLVSQETDDSGCQSVSPSFPMPDTPQKHLNMKPGMIKHCLKQQLPTGPKKLGSPSLTTLPGAEAVHNTQEEENQPCPSSHFSGYMSDEETNSLYNCVGSRTSLDVDVVFERLETSSNKWSTKETKSDNSIPLLDDESSSIEEKFINPLAINSVDSLFRGSTLSLECSDESTFLEDADLYSTSILSLHISDCESSKSSRPSGSLEECSSDKTNEISMCCHIGNGSINSSISCNGASDLILHRCGSYDSEDCPSKVKAPCLQERLRMISETKERFCRPGCRGHGRKSREHAIKPPNADVMGLSPECFNRNRSHSYICKPDWYKIESVACELVKICSARRNSQEEPASCYHSGDEDDPKVVEQKYVRATKTCIKKLNDALGAHGESGTSESGD